MDELLLLEEHMNRIIKDEKLEVENGMKMKKITQM